MFTHKINARQSLESNADTHDTHASIQQESQSRIIQALCTVLDFMKG